MRREDINLGSLILPCEVFTHFEVVDIIDGAKEIQLFLDERFVPPTANGYSSKGFTEQSVIQDFPLRGKAAFLHIRRRGWQRPQPSIQTSYQRLSIFTISKSSTTASGKKLCIISVDSITQR